MALVRLRPRVYCMQTLHKKLTTAALIQVAKMQRLEAWLLHVAVGIEVRIGRQTFLLRKADNLRVRKAAALGVLHNVEFQLTHTGITLLWQAPTGRPGTAVGLGIVPLTGRGLAPRAAR